MMRTLVYAALVTALASCGDDLDLTIPDTCNPLGGARCITPWPSSIYEVDDATTATGRRLAIPAGALPTNIDRIVTDPAPYNAKDGFSSAAPLVTAFSTGVDPSNLVHYANYADSLTDASPTVLIDIATGELVAHFAELDAPAADSPASQTLFIRPAALLKGSARYAVAIKRTLKARGGGELPIPEGFHAIADGVITTHPLLERVRPRYKEIFAALSQHGIEKDELVTAWDFTTASRENVRADLLDARNGAMPMIGTNGANLAFTATPTPQNDTRIASRFDGTYDAPLFLTNGGTPGPSIALVRDGDGKPMPTGLYRAPFTAIVPQCALTSPTPVPIIIYGHGLFGNATQTASSGTRTAAAGICAVAIGTDMRGMSDVDVPNVALALNDVNRSGVVFDVLVQGMLNNVALVQIARGPMAASLFVNSANQSIVDPSRVYYYGISQGGIMGTTVCAIDPVISRCVLQVGAANFSMLLERSRDWPMYRTTLIGAYPDPLDVVLVITLMQQQWDRTEATSVADVIVGDGFPGTPIKSVLMQMAIGDDEVANVASEYEARTMGIPTLTPSPHVPFGLTGTAGPVANGLVIYDFGYGGTIPRTNEAPPDNNVHGSIRNKAATIEMMKRFYNTGEIVQTCTAANGCDCTAGGCGTEP